jgi:ATPases with chaperone activity, ATP-binding subunit
MFSKFDEEARKVLVGCKKEMSKLKHPYIGSEHLILSMLSNKGLNISKRLNDYGLTYNKLYDELVKVVGFGSETNEWFLYTPLLKRVIEDAIISSKENNNGEVTVQHLFLSLLEEGEGVAIRMMISMGVDIDELYNEFSTNSSLKKTKIKKKLVIEDYGYDMNKKVLSGEIDPVIARDDEINRIIEVLCRRTKNNPLLLGEAGVGKSAIVEELALRIVKGEVPDKLQNKRIISIAMANLVSGTKYRGEFEDRITKILKEIENDDSIIIFIDEIHTLVGAGGAEGAIDASNILKPALSRGKLKVIGATTISEYKKYMEDDRALARRFQRVDIEEPDEKKLYAILKELKPIYESFHAVSLDDDVLELIIKLSNKYIYDRKQPDKAIDILDEICAKVAVSKDEKMGKLNNYKKHINDLYKKKNDAIVRNDFDFALTLKNEEKSLEDKISKLEQSLLLNGNIKKVTKDMIAEVIMLKSKIPVYELASDSIGSLKDLETRLNSIVIGQSSAISKLCSITKKIRMGFRKENRPSSFLFVGSTGVGKTLLVKEYVSNLFNKDNLIRLDMSEYKEEHSISKIIGSPPGYVGYNNKVTVLEEVKNKPHSVILLDEIEKAHKSVINLFLQALDEGSMKDASGNNYRLDNNIIIMTSNLGVNNKGIGFNEKNEEFINNKVKEYLGVEFVNRIDNVLIFNNLTSENIRIIIKNKIKELKKKFNANDIVINNKVIEELIEMSDYKIFGARKVNRIISDRLEDIIINGIINGENKIKIETVK